MTDDEAFALALAEANEPDTAANRAAYARLRAEIRDMPDLPPPAGWEERAEAGRVAIDERRARNRRLWRIARVAIGLLVAAAIGLCAWLWLHN